MQRDARNREPTQSASTMTSYRGRLISTGTYLLLLSGCAVLLSFISRSLFEHNRGSRYCAGCRVLF